MNATTRSNRVSLDKRVMVDITGLMELLSCGRATARDIGERAEAGMKCGKRMLYNVDKVREFTYKDTN